MMDWEFFGIFRIIRQAAQFPSKWSTPESHLAHLQANHRRVISIYLLFNFINIQVVHTHKMEPKMGIERIGRN
jgi:hypothetical protein